MTIWTQRLANHPAIAGIRDIENTLEALRSEEELPAEDIEGIERLHQVILHLKRRISGLDGNLVSSSILERLSTRLTAVAEPVVQYASLPNSATLSQANSAADLLLESLGEVAGILTVEDAGDLKEAIISLRQSVGQHIRRATDEVERLNVATRAAIAKVEDLAKEIESREGRLDDAISRVNDQHTAAQSARASEYISFLATRTTEWQESERLRTESFVAAQAARDAEWAAEVETCQESLAIAGVNLSKDAQTAIATMEDTLGAWKSTAIVAGEESLRKLDEFRAKAEQLVGIIGRDGMVHGFQSVANAAEQQRLFWLKVAGWSLVGLIVTAILLQPQVLAILDLPSHPATWESFASRVFLSLTFLALAVFGGNQANRLEAVEKKNRQTELELAALGPFLVDLSPTERNDIVKQVADRMFGQHQQLVDLDRDVRLPLEALLDLAKQTKSLIGK